VMESRVICSLALNLLAQVIVLGAGWASGYRRRALKAMVPGAEADKDREILLLQERVAELLSRVEILKEMLHPTAATRYSGRVRLMIIFHITYFDVPRRRVSQVFGIARSTLYRWLERIDGRSGFLSNGDRPGIARPRTWHGWSGKWREPTFIGVECGSPTSCGCWGFRCPRRQCGTS